MFRLFAGNQPLVLVLLPIIPLANLVMEYYFPSFTDYASYETTLWGIDVQTEFSWVLGLTASGCIVLNAILLNTTFNRNEFFERNTYLPALIYVLYAIIFPLSTVFNGEAIAQTFIILMIMQLFQLKQNEDGRAASFNSAFFLAIAGTLNPIYFLLYPFLWLGLIRIRPFVLREYLLTLAGSIVPLLLLFYINPTFYIIEERSVPLLELDQLGGNLFWLAYFSTSVLLIISYRFVLLRLPKSTIRYKRLFSLITLLLVYSFLVALGTNFLLDTDYYSVTGIIVLSFIVPYAFLDARVKFPMTLLYLLILATGILKFVVQ